MDSVWTSYVRYITNGTILLLFLHHHTTITGYEFNGTGMNVPMDACGDRNSLQPVLQSGPHSPSLMVNFRSNRRNTGMDFFLAITCTLTQEASATNGQSSNDASTASIAPLSADKSLSREGTECTRTRSLSGAIVGTDPSRFISARQYIVSNNNIIIIVCLLIITH